MTNPILLHVAAITNDGRLWHALRQPASWIPFADIEDLASHPRDGAGQEEGFKDCGFAFIPDDAPAGGPQLHLCAVTGAGGLLHTMRDPAGTTWVPFGDAAQQAGASNNFDRVAIAAIDRDLHVCGLGADGRLQHTIRRADSTWLPFGDVSAQAGQLGPFKAVACCFKLGNGAELPVFALSADGRLYQTTRLLDGSWTPWIELFSGSGPFRDVACARTWDLGASFQLQLFLITEDGKPRHATHVLGDPPWIWSALGDVAGQAGDQGSGERVAVAAVGPDNNGTLTELHVCMTTADGHLWHTIRHPNSWEPFRDVEQPAGDRGPVKAVAVAPADPLPTLL